MTWKLAANPSFAGCPVVLVVLDGVGVGHGDEADAVKLARTPVLDSLWTPGMSCALRAHGTAVGLPSEADMGNSEVGHNALGSGQVYDQGAKLVQRAIADDSLFASEVWQDVLKRANDGGAIHFIGLLSDGNVHSHIDHLFAMLRAAAKGGAGTLRVHALLDGRDVPATSALEYIDKLEGVLGELRGAGIDARIASGGGRMLVTMDRYEADWGIVERGYNAHVHGAGRRFSSAQAAVECFREEAPGIGDQFLPEFVIEDDGKPVGPIVDGDSVICFNFRGDRAIEISRAFDDEDFGAFDRGQRPEVLYCAMMEYDGDAHVPARYLVTPPAIERTMGEFLARNKVAQLAISETQKYGHVTYFWNGNRTGKFDDKSETYIEIPSDLAPFEERPWMKAAEITDSLINELRTGAHQFTRVNYANGDMVGHTGSLDATVVAVEAIDIQLGRLRRVIDQVGGILLVTADHGNADEMFFHDKGGHVIRNDKGQPKVRTSHSLNAVPLLIYDPKHGGGDRYRIDPDLSQEAGIGNVTAICYELLGFAPPEGIEPSLLRFK
jgi:2,3-bisphosphoglycerate-independent phosphoglycerate mutase